MRNWYQNEIDEEIKGVDSRDKVKQIMITTQERLSRLAFETDIAK